MISDKEHIITRCNSGCTIVSFPNHQLLDSSRLLDIEKELSALVEAQSNIRLLLRLGNVWQLSSGMLGSFLRLQKRVRQVGGQLAFTEASPQVHKVIRLTGIDRVLSIYRTEQEAVRAMSKAQPKWT